MGNGLSTHPAVLSHAGPALSPHQAPLTTAPWSLFLHFTESQLQVWVQPTFCFLQPHCLLPQRPLQEHCERGEVGAEKLWTFIVCL